MYGGQCMGTYTKSILDLSRVCTHHGIQLQFSFLFNESLITRARNYMAAEFLNTNNTHMLFIDADIEFNPMDVLALLALDKPIACGPYPKKALAWENIYDAARFGLVPDNERGKLADFAGDFVFNAIPGTQTFRVDEPLEVLESGTGFMLIERSVFGTFAEKFPEYWYTPDHHRSAMFNGSRKIYQYFQAEIDPKTTRYLSEDYWFCQKAREAGCATWLAPWMQLKHHGSYVYSGGIGALAAVTNARTERGLAAPAVAPMSVADPAPVVEVTKPKDPGITVLHYNNMSKKQKAFTLETLASKFNTPLAELTELVKTHLPKLVIDSPNVAFEDAIGNIEVPDTPKES